MDRTDIAKELVEVARMLAGSDEVRTAAAKDLAYIREVIPEMREKQAEYDKKKQEQLFEMNRMWHEATEELEKRIKEIQEAIRDELVKYFEGNGMGVRKADASGGLVEVFIGSDDGVKRYQSKVSTHIALMFEGRETANFKMRNETLEDVGGDLANQGTIAKLMTAVKKADKKGFWAQPEM